MLAGTRYHTAAAVIFMIYYRKSIFSGNLCCFIQYVLTFFSKWPWPIVLYRYTRYRNQFRQVPYKIILIRLDPLIDALL